MDEDNEDEDEGITPVKKGEKKASQADQVRITDKLAHSL